MRRCCYGTRRRPGRLLFSLDGDDTPGAVHMLHEGPRASTAPLQEKVVSRHRAWIREVRVAVDSGRSGAAANVGGEQRMKQMSVRKKMTGGPKGKMIFYFLLS